MSEFDIRRERIEITSVNYFGTVNLKIGNLVAAIVKPNASLFRRGLVHLSPVNGSDWPSLAHSNTNEPRLLWIANKILSGRIAELNMGMFFPKVD
ncbi:MAG: hypothetical protein LBT64_03045 [Puniceicoccales bacterium]|jgi:hypothetical protein|nr:hypothetical protein [Puniceicoccales bacterium]